MLAHCLGIQVVCGHKSCVITVSHIGSCWIKIKRSRFQTCILDLRKTKIAMKFGPSDLVSTATDVADCMLHKILTAHNPNLCLGLFGSVSGFNGIHVKGKIGRSL